MKWFALMLAAVVVGLSVAGTSSAAPIPGTFDSREPGSNVLASLWDDCTDIVGMFCGQGNTELESQWYIEAYDPDWSGGYYGYMQLNANNDAPWFGDNPALVGGYEGDITSWTLVREITYGEGDVMEYMVGHVTGVAVLNKRHMEPWHDWTYEAMDPVTVLFEMGFDGVPQQESWSGIFGTPEYAVITIVPEPSMFALLAALGLGVAFCVRRRG